MSEPPPESTVARLRATLREVTAGGRGWTLLAVAGGWFFVLGLRFVVPALLPAITDDFPVSNAAAGAAITLLWVTYALIQFPAGALVDRVGERRLLVASALLSAAGLVGYLGSVTFAVFLAATAAFGFGSGLYGPARGTVLSRTFPDRDGLAFGTVLATGSIGAAALPVVATLLAGEIGWRLAIGVTIPGFLLVAVALWRSVPAGTAVGADDGAEGTPAIDGGATEGGATDGGATDCGATDCGATDCGATDCGATDCGATDGGATDGGGLDLRHELAAVRTAISNGAVALAVIAATLMLFSFQGLTAFLTTYLVDVKSLTEGTAGILFGIVFVSGALFQSVGGGLADRYGHGRVLAAAAFVSVPPLVALPLLSGILPLALVAAALGIRLSIGPVSNAYIVSLLPVDVRGTAWGLLRTGFFTLGAFGSIAVGAMADRALFAEAFFLLAAMTAVAGAVYLFLPAREGVGA